MKKLIVNLILIMSLTACHPSGEEVAGKYYAKHDKGTEYIEMRTDGTFTQYFKKGSKEETNEGTWDFEHRKGQWKLELEGFVTYVSPFGNDHISVGKKGNASIYWEGDLISMWGDGDDEYNYHRKE
jgi:hypothetical protein